jgi:hypothetical protein
LETSLLSGVVFFSASGHTSVYCSALKYVVVLYHALPTLTYIARVSLTCRSSPIASCLQVNLEPNSLVTRL